MPISKPEEDSYGLNPFASALAKSIENMEAPNGVVLSVNGAWGSGKSSAINLVKFHLLYAVEKREIVLVPFNPWWFSGADALTLAFFRELSRAIAPSLSRGARKSIEALGQGVSALGTVAGAVANLKAPGVGTIISGLAGLFGKITGSQRTVDQERKLVSDELKKQNKRFVVVIDDIDRLSPDDALTIFRLIKSVGQLPNVIYVLAFDRAIAERIVSERFPSEGASYLEKILQGSFDLPPPLIDVLRMQCAELAFAIMGSPSEAATIRFWNIFHDVVAPTIKTPRDIVRLRNQLSTAWPSVAGQVDRADFFAITALQLAEPAIYNAIRTHSGELCGGRTVGDARDPDASERYDAMLDIANRPEPERARLRIALRRLFPLLDSIWANTYHAGNNYRRSRRVASSEHFRSYFAYSVSDDVLPAERVNGLIEKADNVEFVTSEVRAALRTVRRNGTTQAAILLQELTDHVAEIDKAKVPTFVATLFHLADEIDVEADEGKGFLGLASNKYRLYWLLINPMKELFTQQERDAIYTDALTDAAVGWSVDFAEHCLSYYHREDGEERNSEPTVSEPVAENIRAIALQKIRASGEDDSLIRHPKLTTMLFEWRRLAGQDCGAAEVRAWTDGALSKPEFVVALAKSLPSTSWSHGMGFDGMGDRVQRANIRVNLQPYLEILDVPRFEAKVAELIEAGKLPDDDLTTLRQFATLPRGSHDRMRDED
jgi:predicted KAP-like P-loop ATPase